MRKPEFYAAVFGIIKNEKGEILMIKRQNTGFRDGYLALPAGHIEAGETPIEALRKEMKEELGIDIDISQIKPIHIGHRFSPQENSDEVRQYFSFFFEIGGYQGTLYNAESEKSAGIFWIDWKKEEKIQFRDILILIDNGEFYSEIDDKNY